MLGWQSTAVLSDDLDTEILTYSRARGAPALLTLRESNPEHVRPPFSAIDQLCSDYREELAF
jgi:hypothetical protein